jgi:hypothetical protein
MKPALTFPIDNRFAQWLRDAHDGWLVSILRHSASNVRRHYHGASKREVAREVSLDHPNRQGTPRDELEAGGPSSERACRNQGRAGEAGRSAPPTPQTTPAGNDLAN